MRWLALIALLPTASWAAPLTVRGGEHADFTRLVVAMPQGTDWQITPSDRGARLSMAGDFDTSAAFDRIPRSRLAALSVQDGDLLMSFACDCAATAFVWQETTLVIDIAKAEAPPASLPIVTPRPVPIPPPIPMQTGSPTEEALAVSIAQAAGLGLLEPAETLPLPTDTPVQGTAGLRMFSPLDLATGGTATEVAPFSPCLPDSHFPDASWLGNGTFNEARARMNRALTGEFDRINTAVADDLSRFYAAYALTTESRQIGNDIAVILDVIDGANGFADQAGCAGAAALWHYLGGGTAPDDVTLQREFERLPLPLRIHFAGDLATRLWNQGRFAAGRNITAFAPPDADLTMANALMTDDPADGLSLLTASLDPRDNARLVQAARFANDHDLTLPADTIPLIGAAKRFLTDAASQHDLTRAEVAGLTVQGNFAQAVALLNQSEVDPDATIIQLASGGTDADALTIAVTALPTRTGPDARKALADRLRHMGFTTEAAAIDGHQPAASPPPDTPVAKVAPMGTPSLAASRDALTRAAETRGAATDTLKGL